MTSTGDPFRMPDFAVEPYRRGWRVVQVREDGTRKTVRARLATKSEGEAYLTANLPRLQRLIDRMNRELSR